MKPEKIIYDGDMGGDDLWAIAMVMAHNKNSRINNGQPEAAFDIRGITTVFGNVSQPYATQNILKFLNWLGETSIPVFQGADGPIDGRRPFRRQRLWGGWCGRGSFAPGHAGD